MRTCVRHAGMTFLFVDESPRLMKWRGLSYILASPFHAGHAENRRGKETHASVCRQCMHGYPSTHEVICGGAPAVSCSSAFHTGVNDDGWRNRMVPIMNAMVHRACNAHIPQVVHRRVGMSLAYGMLDLRFSMNADSIGWYGSAIRYCIGHRRNCSCIPGTYASHDSVRSHRGVSVLTRHHELHQGRIEQNRKGAQDAGGRR